MYLNTFQSIWPQVWKVCRCFASFSSEQELFTHDIYMTALIRPSYVNKSNRSCSMKE